MPDTIRKIQDASLSQSVALPNAANSTTTNSINLEAVTPFPTTEHFQVRISTTVATGANSKNINCSIQDSADNGNWTNIAALAPIVMAGNSANHIASAVSVQLPPNTRQYLRAVFTGEANGGNSGDGTGTIQLLF